MWCVVGFNLKNDGLECVVGPFTSYIDAVTRCVNENSGADKDRIRFMTMEMEPPK